MARKPTSTTASGEWSRSCGGDAALNLRDLLQVPRQFRRLASDMVTIAALFQGEPELGAELIHACLPGLLSHLVESGGKLTDVGRFLQEPADVVNALRSIDWAVDDDLLETLTQVETGPILRRWSTIFGNLVEHPVIGEELERRAAEAYFGSWDEGEDDA